MQKLTRRDVLRGAGGIALSLPWLEAMAANPKDPQGPVPKRVGYVYVPNGIYMSLFQPRQAGRDFDMPEIMQPMRPFQERMIVYTGIDNPAGQHGGAECWLTGVHPGKFPGFTFKNTVSVDQVIARSEIGKATRYPSLEVSVGAAVAGGSGTGAYLSWSHEGVPLGREGDPRSLYEKLFVPDNAKAVDERIARLRQEKRLLDSVLEDAKSLQRKLGVVDQRKVDEYLQSIREVEEMLAREEVWAHTAKPTAKLETTPSVVGGTEDKHRAHLATIALALQTDSTRVFTYFTGGEAGRGGGSSYPNMVNHHGGSHCSNDEPTTGLDKLQQGFVDINKLELQIFADFVAKLAAMQEGESTVLDNSCLFYGCSQRRNNHWHQSIPLITVGSLGGRLRTGQHVRLADFPIEGEFGKNKPEGRPIGDLHLTILRQLGLDAKSHGWGTKVIDEICV
jgi:hypothetical protein